MTASPENLFAPGTGIDVIFHLNATTPVLRAAMIHDTGPGKDEFILSQTRPPLTPDLFSREMHVTTLAAQKGTGKKRYGMPCRITGSDKRCPISENVREEVLFIHQEGPVQEINIRSAYRVTPGKQFPVFLRLQAQDREYLCGRDFSILDISATGIGILALPENRNTGACLLDLETDSALALGLALQYPSEKGLAAKKVLCLGRVARKTQAPSKKAEVIGLHFTRMPVQAEADLHHFIHEAQMEEIRRLSPYK